MRREGCCNGGSVALRTCRLRRARESSSSPLDQILLTSMETWTHWHSYVQRSAADGDRSKAPGPSYGTSREIPGGVFQLTPGDQMNARELGLGYREGARARGQSLGEGLE
ncbi:hypothetical protein ANANG_G00156730 [Anguilla anguilla]|uniref:Uncharacterized protein n=1 Tax=Anguilla anguilla TaxID=7936 RepID=A0A9D3RUY6_ANGAN|nr:hypothetical protein ANANG_G00156730 [Anguilla anguilla]